MASILLLAGTVVGCANNPPPPPPMAAVPDTPPPPPAPAAPMKPMAGSYKGMADLASDAPANCRKMTRTQTAMVRGTTISLGGMRGRIAGDGTVTPVGRSGLSGMVSGNTADITTLQGKCSYHYNLMHG